MLTLCGSAWLDRRERRKGPRAGLTLPGGSRREARLEVQLREQQCGETPSPTSAWSILARNKGPARELCKAWAELSPHPDPARPSASLLSRRNCPRMLQVFLALGEGWTEDIPWQAVLGWAFGKATAAREKSWWCGVSKARTGSSAAPSAPPVLKSSSPVPLAALLL